MSDKLAKRDENGRWLKGHCPPGAGRPKGYKAQAKEIQNESKNGQELRDFLFNVLRGTIEGGTPLQARMWACEQLWNRGYGRAPQIVEVTSDMEHDPGTSNMDISELTDEELETMEKASAIATRLANKRKPIDV